MDPIDEERKPTIDEADPHPGCSNINKDDTPLLRIDKEPEVLFVTEDESDPLALGSKTMSGLSLIGDPDSPPEIVGDTTEAIKELEKDSDWSASGSGEFGSSQSQPEPIEEENDDDEGQDLNFLSSEEWKTQKRHIFILSESGKPVYSRHGNEDKLVTLFGLMQALVSVVQDDGDAIRAIRVGKVKIVFVIKSPLILVGVSRLDHSIPQIQTQLMYFYNQVVSVLTSKQLEQIYEKRRNYDLRRLLAGSERLLTSLSNSMEEDPSYLLGAVKCLPISSSIRDTIANTIVQFTSKLKDIVFAILIANNQLVTLIRMKRCFMHPIDLHIILNLINASESFKTVESWTPICLPRFDSSGFVHAHVSYLADDCEACLIILTVDRDSFFVLSEAKQKIVEKLRKTNCLDAINTSMKSNWPTMKAIAVPQIRHFIYKSKHIAQFVSPTLSLPYTTEQLNNGSTSPHFARLFAAYARIHARLHSHSRPLRLLYSTTDKENFMGWITSTFELYLTFEPLTKKSAAIAGVDKLLKWVKKEEERLFIINSPTF